MGNVWGRYLKAAGTSDERGGSGRQGVWGGAVAGDRPLGEAHYSEASSIICRADGRTTSSLRTRLHRPMSYAPSGITWGMLELCVFGHRPP
jgi:hypothetical protein